MNCLAVFGCLGLTFAGLVACADEEAASKPNVPGNVVVNPDTGDTLVVNPETGDSSKQQIDTVTHIDPITGDTIKKIDTLLIPLDSTMRWVGNSALVITEIAPVNLNWLDEEGRDPGWVEIYNAGSEAANLKGYALIETTEKGRKWIFGDELIAAKSFRTVFCDKKNLVTAPSDTEFGKGRTHTNWKLEKDGGTVYLVDQYFGIRDSVKYPSLESGVSWGIVDGGAWKYFGKPTPEKANNVETAYEGMAPEFKFNGSQGGFYNEPVVLNAPTVSDGMKVRCTQNGSEPTKDSPEFNQTITIEKNTVLRCAAFKDGLLTKKTVTNTYFIGEQVKMPVVAVTVDSVFFRNHYVPKSRCSGDDPKTCPEGLMADVEFPAHVEYFAEGSKSKEKAWEIDAGISLMGGWSRVANKKSVAVVIREEYQNGWLHYPLFETRKDTHSKFKGFNLRNNGNRFVSDYMEDAVGGAALEGSGVDYQRSRQVVVFYNGKYWGIHDMRERFNKNYVETNYGIDAGNVEIIKILGRADSSLSGNTLSAVNNFKGLLDIVGNGDFSGDNNPNYASVKTLMDVGNFADYMIAEIYYKNGDWPNNNVRAWRAPGQPWKFMIYDLDHGFGWVWGVNDGEFKTNSTNMFSWIKKGGGNKPCKESGCFANLYIQLIKNPEFKRLFLNHAAVMHQNYLNTSVISNVVDRIEASMDADDIERDYEEFHSKGKTYYEEGFSKDGTPFKSWSAKRDDSVLEDYAGEFGVSNRVNVTIGANGKGKVLMEGMTLPGGKSSYTGKFYAGIGMELTAVPDEGAIFAGWSDGSTDPTHLIATDSDVTITANFK
ncbi:MULTISPECIES: CotH kinase family protein [unclassified Fibrobacter]|uniref:CotH kinase family protein n=1 Tax=unclassified Fibrobacter TaxID=2634177 RepID=UPI001304BF33|nr:MULTISPECIES: CotH kinase family protein [unclassified Fibrobacter]